MTQQQINLLPESIRQRCEAGAKTGRLITALVCGVLLVVVLATHARFQLERVRASYRAAEEAAAEAHSAEQQYAVLSAELDTLEKHIRAYERLALPLNISSVLATIINELPGSVTLESFALEAGERRTVRVSRNASEDTDEVPRVIVGELSGFAVSDHEIAELVSRLGEVPAFESVTMDFSRTRQVRENPAREFRLSFRIDLNVPYIVESPSVEAHANVEGETR